MGASEISAYATAAGLLLTALGALVQQIVKANRDKAAEQDKRADTTWEKTLTLERDRMTKLEAELHELRKQLTDSHSEAAQLRAEVKHLQERADEHERRSHECEEDRRQLHLAIKALQK